MSIISISSVFASITVICAILQLIGVIWFDRDWFMKLWSGLGAIFGMMTIGMLFADSLQCKTVQIKKCPCSCNLNIQEENVTPPIPKDNQ